MINRELSAMLDGVTKEELAMALADLLDGQSTIHDITDNTGLPVGRAIQISDLYNNNVREFALRVWNG